MSVKLSAPSKVIWLVATILGFVAIAALVLAKLGIAVPLVSIWGWVLAVAFVLLFVGTTFTGI
ncbi:MAG: hypothetical protein LBG67_02820 [Campylobacteraceae bacterium]|jgi:hypothetical protein|nr:hypothetical protein [Campylobacteraceae bacterium]